jgi:hypothetical protein
MNHQVTPVEELTDTDKRQMHQLMERHFDNMDWDVFLQDLAEKNWVIRLFDEKTGELTGFSTQMLFPIEIDGKEVLAVFSGDTIVDRESWGTMALGLAAVRLAFSLIGQHPGRELYWFLISKGFRTYRFLPVYFYEFYPRHDQQTPARAKEIIDACGRRKFSDRYDPTTGIVRADENGCRLRDGVGTVTDERLNDPHVKFFLERNPEHAAGNELCCIAALKPENFVARARKWVEVDEGSKANS